MPKYVIEREIEGAGRLTREELDIIKDTSCAVLGRYGVQWLESFVTPDKVYCIYIAPNEDLIRKCAEECGLPADRISEVRNIIGPLDAVAA